MGVTGQGMQDEDDIAFLIVERAECLVGNRDRAETAVAFQNKGIRRLSKGEKFLFHQSHGNPAFIMFDVFAHCIKA